MTAKEFLNNTVTHGGDWTATLLEGIKRNFPEYYAKMENKSYSFIEVYNITVQLGVEWTYQEDEEVKNMEEVEVKKTVTMTVAELKKLCDDLYYGGDEYFYFYCTIEEACMEYEDAPDDTQVTLELSGTDVAYENLKNYYGVQV